MFWARDNGDKNQSYDASYFSMYFDDGDLEFIEEASDKRYWVFGRVRTGLNSDVRLIIIWIVRLETF